MSAFSFLRPMDETDLIWVNAVELMAYDFPWTENGFIKAMDNGVCYVFSDSEDNPLGYACFIMVVDELQLLNFCVSPDVQGQGVGQAAMQALLTHFMGVGYRVMLLEVRVSNEAALHLYKKLGFKVDGVRRNYYRVKNAPKNAQEDAILMSYEF